MQIKKNIEFCFPKELVDFLKEENVLDLFMENKPCLKATDINQAFIWSETREGAKFWGKLHSKYYRLTNEKEFK